MPAPSGLCERRSCTSWPATTRRVYAHARGRAITMPPAYRYGKQATLADVAEDWAIVYLERQLAIRPIPVRALPAGPLLDRRPQRAGYSQDRAHLLSIHEGCRLRGMLAEGRVPLTDCDGTHGDSGSPLLLREGGEIWLVGVASAVMEEEAREGGLASMPRPSSTACRRLRVIQRA